MSIYDENVYDDVSLAEALRQLYDRVNDRTIRQAITVVAESLNGGGGGDDDGGGDNTDLSNYYNKQQVDDKLADKVDKEDGKALSTNDFTDDYKAKVDSIAQQIAAAIAEVVADAPASFDTLKEIADWIANHSESASAMNSAIVANTAAIETLDDNKVDKVTGKGLSTEDFTTALKTKLNGLYNYNDTQLKTDISSLNATVGYMQKNIVELIQPETLQHINGIDFMFTSDGKFVANGTATTDTYIKVTENVSGYNTTGLVLTGCPAGGSLPPNGYALAVATANNYQENFGYDFGFGSLFSLPPHVEEWAVWCHIGTGVTVNNLEFAPMVRLESVQDGTFEPHKPTVDQRLERLEAWMSESLIQM